MAEDWTRAGAIARMHANPTLQEALRREPGLQPLLDAALQQQNVLGYHRMRTYDALKARANLLVGWEAERREVWGDAGEALRFHTVVVRTLDDLLPPDEADLYPEGSTPDSE